MADSDTILGAITSAQNMATLKVILPLLLCKETFYTQAAVQEWEMFQPLSAAFATLSAPATAYSQPLQFVNWLLAHPEVAGSQKYVQHIVQYANSNAAVKALEIHDIPLLLNAEKALNLAGIIVPGHEVK